MKLILILINIFISILLILLKVESHKKIVFCYYASWNVYSRRMGHGIPLDEVDWKLCTHIGYAYFDVSANGTVVRANKWEYVENLDSVAKIEALKNSTKPHIKTILVIGNQKFGAKNFANVIKNFDTIQRFIKTVIDFMDMYNFDGLEIDWEYPYEIVIESKDNFILFLQMVKILLQFKNYTLSASLAASESKAKIFYSIPEMHKYLDFINLKTYDFYDNWSYKTGFYSPLQDLNNPFENIKAAVDYWIHNGVPAHKLILGISFYGRTFKLKDKSDNRIGAPIIGTGIPGKRNQNAGLFTYFEICVKLHDKTITEQFDENTKCAYAVNERLWITYENPRSLYHKIEYMKLKKLGGVMIWSIDADDFIGSCDNKFQLMHFINDALNNDRIISFKSNNQILLDAPPGDVFLCPGPGLYPTKYFCEKFHVCAEAGDTQTMIMFCPPGLLFDDRLGKCNWPSAVNCTAAYN